MKPFFIIVASALVVFSQAQNPNIGLGIDLSQGICENVPTGGENACVLLKITRPLDTASIDSLHYSRGAKLNDSVYLKGSEPAYKITEWRADDYFFTDRILSEEHEVFGWIVMCACEAKRGFAKAHCTDTTFTNAGGYCMVSGLSEEQKKILATKGYINGRLTGGNAHIAEGLCESCAQ